MLSLLLLASLAQASDYYECMVRAGLVKLYPINAEVVLADLEILATAGGRCASGSKSAARIGVPEGTDPATLSPGTEVLLHLTHMSGMTAAGPSTTESWLLLGAPAEVTDPQCRLEAEVVAICDKPLCAWLDIVPSTPTTTLGCPARGLRTRIEAITPASLEALQVGDRVRARRDGPHLVWTVIEVEAPRP